MLVFIRNNGLKIQLMSVFSLMFLAENVLLFTPTILFAFSLSMFGVIAMEFIVALLYRDKNISFYQNILKYQGTVELIASIIFSIIILFFAFYTTFFVAQLKNESYLAVLYLLPIIMLAQDIYFIIKNSMIRITLL